MVGGGDPFYLKFWVNWPPWSGIADFQPIFARSSSAVTPSKKVQLTLIESPLRSFQLAQDEHRTLFLSPPKGGSKTQSIRIRQLKFSVEFGEKKTQNNGYYGVQGHSMSSRSVPMESPYMWFPISD